MKTTLVILFLITNDHQYSANRPFYRYKHQEQLTCHSTLNPILNR